MQADLPGSRKPCAETLACEDVLTIQRTVTRNLLFLFRNKYTCYIPLSIVSVRPMHTRSCIDLRDSCCALDHLNTECDFFIVEIVNISWHRWWLSVLYTPLLQKMIWTLLGLSMLYYFVSEIYWSLSPTLSCLFLFRWCTWIEYVAHSTPWLCRCTGQNGLK